MIRNAVANGLNKVQITLKPKSLGKINLDISVKDNSTKIQNKRRKFGVSKLTKMKILEKLTS